ncbi:sporulation membrane protein YtaF [Clostridium drakei]|uniref:Sporulation membrane protein YtaF n=1 Tax=Clostridium drakei TaxID=332101 RepID=A0A2U8DSR2_9CLOT|nr:sporulation membrane protein YtaF [Clostridium drakei]AWI05826.1 sporulation membrane protein YtaF [Clostridium drakei]
MHLIYTVFIALINNLDNISVRIAYSIRGIKISTLKNLWISVITFVISSLAAFSGNFLTKVLSSNISSILSMLLLIIIGLWIIVEPYFNKASEDKMKQDPSIYNVLRNLEIADLDNSKDIDYKEATLLGVAMSVNNIGGGISAGMIGLNSILIGLFSAIISFLALWSGNYITEFFNKRNLGKKATFASGIILILIGIKQVI